jgi:hypothetical protein
MSAMFDPRIFDPRIFNTGVQAADRLSIIHMQGSMALLISGGRGSRGPKIVSATGSASILIRGTGSSDSVPSEMEI